MKHEDLRLFPNLLHGQDGQVLPVVALLMVALLGMVGLVVDVGHVYLCHRELQASCDAAALAGAEVIPTALQVSDAQAKATAYSSVSGASNFYNNMSNITMVSGYPSLECLSTMQLQGISCVGTLPFNAIQVMQQATVPMYFARLVGKPSMTITAAATAAKGGASSRPYNLAILLDTTLSMTYYDGDCGNTQMLCTLTGVQLLLQHLDPCGRSQTACTVVAGNSTNSVVRAGLFTFPQVTTSTVGYDSDCSNNTPTATAYTFPVAGAGAYVPVATTYRALDFHSDYKLADTSTSLNPISALTLAAGGTNGCAGMGPPANAGQYGTYYAATIYAAQSALVAEQTIYPDSQNVMIILGDGDSNAPQNFNGHAVMGAGSTSNGKYPSWNGECGQAVKAAKLATAQGTRVYTVAYGAAASGCTTDSNAGDYPNISPCNTLAYMASAPWYFFSDYRQTGSASTCVAAQVMVELSDIFLQIAGDLTVARLIPNNTT